MNQLVCLLVGKIKHYLQTKAQFTYTYFRYYNIQAIVRDREWRGLFVGVSQS